MSRQSPAFTRSTSGRGRFESRSLTLPAARPPLPDDGTMSRSRAKIMPPGCDAPRRFSQNCWSRATTCADTVLPGPQCGAAAAAAGGAAGFAAGSARAAGAGLAGAAGGGAVVDAPATPAMADSARRHERVKAVRRLGAGRLADRWVLMGVDKHGSMVLIPPHPPDPVT